MTNKESLFASLHILMRAILMAQRTPAAGFTDTGIEKAAAKSASAGKYKISVNLCNLRLISLRAFVSLWLKNPFNQGNLRLINDLRAFGIFTLVESALQIKLFMQNKANFRKSQMNVNKVFTKDYDKMDTWSIGKNKANQSQFKANYNQ